MLVRDRETSAVVAAVNFQRSPDTLSLSSSLLPVPLNRTGQLIRAPPETALR